MSLAAVSCAVAGLVAGGCGGTRVNGAAGTPTTPTSSSVPPTVPTTLPALPSPTRIPPTPAKGGGPFDVVVRGVIEKGVEAGCWVLTPDQGGPRYVLITRIVPPTGVPVTVHGIARPDRVSYCQQGTPLQAEKIEPR